MSNFLQQAKTYFPTPKPLRRDFHLHPELGFNEIRTGGIVAKELEALGLKSPKASARPAWLACSKVSKPGSCHPAAFRHGCPAHHRRYRRGIFIETTGVMHACGHDGHTAIGLTVAKYPERIQGRI
jgi:amidohydrolase